MLLSSVFEGVPFTAPAFEDREIADIVYDSRKAAAGTLFVALTGAYSDGHDYVNSAYLNGARAFLVQKEVSLPADALVLTVGDTRAVLSAISANFFRHPERELKIVGVTGTKGKTTVVNMLRFCLDAAGLFCGVIGTVGAQYGDVTLPTVNTTPESYECMKLFRQMADAGCKAVCMEVSSIGLKAHRVDDIPFTTAVFTNLTPDHIGGAEHESFEEYAYWKKQLFYRCQQAVLCADDAFSEELKEILTVPYLTYGVYEPADVTARNIEKVRASSFFGSRFLCVAGDEERELTISMPGVFSVLNALACVAVCRQLDADMDAVAEGLKNAVAKGRNEVLRLDVPYDVVVDYAHNGQSFHSVLDTFTQYEHNRIITVFGSVGGRAQLRREEMGTISGTRADLTIITTDDPNYEDPAAICAEIARAVEKAGGKYEIIVDREAAVHRALSLAEPGDIVLLLGKGHEQAQKVRGGLVPYSDIGSVKSYFDKK
ncbi:MAG: UDP-N-acetylmuramoyl-L-alanyl-D-glutamate--2,6-diaminopimelate ligase [Clostridia bacterium]|nr:UDP-N-acetylmuramoyl-L-alanyl-D-glutamate--2,6-diaminopimelate ligase [Clostridia bacterium]